MAKQRLFMPFNYDEIIEQNAWLLGFIFAESTIGIHLGIKVVKIYNKNKFILDEIKEIHQIPYKVTTQNNRLNTVYFIRISDPKFVSSIERLGFEKDKSNLSFPKMSKECEEKFISGFLTGKGSFFSEPLRKVYGFKIIYRSRTFMNELSYKIANYARVKVANLYCQKIVNLWSCEIKYVNEQANKVTNYFNISKIIEL